VSPTTISARLAIVGATGRLGRLVVDHLLGAGVHAEQVVAVGRNHLVLNQFAARGVTTRFAERDDPEVTAAALDGVDRILLISGIDVGRRTEQHATVIEVAKRLQTDLFVYTSLPNAAESPMLLAREHAATERLLYESGLPGVVLRNGWYLDKYVDEAAEAIVSGTVFGASGSGRVSPATRADLAEAAARVLLEESHAGATYELGGDQSFTLAEYAQQISDWSGRSVRAELLSTADYAEHLRARGVPSAFADVLADNEAGQSAGYLFIDTGDLRNILGRPPMTLPYALKAASNTEEGATI
jgi:NAD(P)H dehydrogenase (quinone)